MKYHSGLEVLLGDHVTLPVPEGHALARVVMLGDTSEHLPIDAQFLKWVGSTDVLVPTSIVVEWLSRNPFAHDDPAYSPVGSYMFTTVDEFVELECRAEGS